MSYLVANFRSKITSQFSLVILISPYDNITSNSIKSNTPKKYFDLRLHFQYFQYFDGFIFFYFINRDIFLLPIIKFLYIASITSSEMFFNRYCNEQLYFNQIVTWAH